MVAQTPTKDGEMWKKKVKIRAIKKNDERKDLLRVVLLPLKWMFVLLGVVCQGDVSLRMSLWSVLGLLPLTFVPFQKLEAHKKLPISVCDDEKNPKECKCPGERTHYVVLRQENDITLRQQAQLSQGCAQNSIPHPGLSLS